MNLYGARLREMEEKEKLKKAMTPPAQKLTQQEKEQKALEMIARAEAIEAERKEHSRKPNEAILRIEELYPDAVKIELFARTKIENWDAWGNETDKFEEEKGREIFNNSFPPQSLFGDVSQHFL